MLASWNQNVSSNRKMRGDEGDIIKAHAIKEDRDRANAEAKAEALAAKSKKGMNYTVNELYRRILKVEKLSDRVHGFGGNTNGNLLDDLKSLNQF